MMCAAPTLFSRMFSAMLTDAFCGGAVAAGVICRNDGGLFNLRRLKAKTVAQVDTVRDYSLLMTVRSMLDHSHTCSTAWTSSPR